MSSCRHVHLSGRAHRCVHCGKRDLEHALQERRICFKCGIEVSRTGLYPHLKYHCPKNPNRKKRTYSKTKRALSVRSACIVPRMQGMLEPIRRKRNHDVFKRNYVFKARLFSRSGGCVSLSVHQREVGSNSTYTNNMMGCISTNINLMAFLLRRAVCCGSQ